MVLYVVICHNAFIKGYFYGMSDTSRIQSETWKFGQFKLTAQKHSLGISEVFVVIACYLTRFTRV